MVPIWVKLPLKKKLRQATGDPVKAGKFVGPEGWVKEIEVDVRPLLLPILRELGHSEEDAAELVLRAFSDPPVLRARCSWVDEDDGVEPKPCPCAVRNDVRKNGKVVGFLCEGHSREFRARRGGEDLAERAESSITTFDEEKRTPLLKPSVPPPFVTDEFTTISASSQPATTDDEED